MIEMAMNWRTMIMMMIFSQLCHEREEPKSMAKGFPKSLSTKNRTKIAVLQAQNEDASIYTAARQNGQSYGYLQRRLSGKAGMASRNGPNPILTNDEEAHIAYCATEMALRECGSLLILLRSSKNC